MTETAAQHRADFRAAVNRLIAASGRMHADRSPEAFAEWHRAVDAVKALHEPIAARALQRVRGSFWP